MHSVELFGDAPSSLRRAHLWSYVPNCTLSTDTDYTHCFRFRDILSFRSSTLLLAPSIPAQSHSFVPLRPSPRILSCHRSLINDAFLYVFTSSFTVPSVLTSYSIEIRTFLVLDTCLLSLILFSYRLQYILYATSSIGQKLGYIIPSSFFDLIESFGRY